MHHTHVPPPTPHRKKVPPFNYLSISFGPRFLPPCFTAHTGFRFHFVEHQGLEQRYSPRLRGLPQKPTLTMYKFMRRSCNEGGAEEEREEETPASILILVSVTRPLFNGLFKSSILSYYSIHLVFTLEKNTHFGNFTSSKDLIWIP